MYQLPGMSTTRARLMVDAMRLIAPSTTVPAERLARRRRWERLSQKGRERMRRGWRTPMQQHLPNAPRQVTEWWPKRKGVCLGREFRNWTYLAVKDPESCGSGYVLGEVRLSRVDENEVRDRLWGSNSYSRGECLVRTLPERRRRSRKGSRDEKGKKEKRKEKRRKGIKIERRRKEGATAGTYLCPQPSHVVDVLMDEWSGLEDDALADLTNEGTAVHAG
ncbi:hypothetical protein OH77DRAFT_1438137 [Trametes cingulata]|nr:hypothetical protein OH77DRAFT_1438137 [Trametes cingulata]